MYSFCCPLDSAVWHSHTIRLSLHNTLRPLYHSPTQISWLDDSYCIMEDFNLCSFKQDKSQRATKRTWQNLILLSAVYNELGVTFEYYMINICNIFTLYICALTIYSIFFLCFVLLRLIQNPIKNYYFFRKQRLL